MSPRTLFVVSTEPTRAAPGGPRKDFSLVAQSLHADVLDRSQVQRASAAVRLLARTLGVPVAQAWLAFRRHRAYGAILTDGEHIGIPLALLLKVARSSVVHVTIGHRVSAAKKRPFFRWLRVQTHITRLVVHARRQYELAVDDLGVPAEQVALLPYQVDTQFWRPQTAGEERLVCSAGLELRDYATLARAVAGLDAQVVIGAASHWSKRRNTADGALPPNVRVDSFDYLALRDLYARAAVVVVPLFETDFQAGVTTILEAMAMGKPVVVTRTQGQTDVIEDGQHATGASLLRSSAALAGVPLEPTGLYVPPGDAAALRRAIVYLLGHPEERHRLGAAGRRTAQACFSVEQFADRLRALVDDAWAVPQPRTAHIRPAARMEQSA